jgi:competence protein ComEA
MTDLKRSILPPVGPWSPAARGVLTALAMGSGLVIAALAPSRRDEPARPPVLVLDVNAAPIEALSALPGIGPALAAEIDARRSEAPFLDLTDLARRARGVGPATLARLARHLRVGPRVVSLGR